jgi:hypothetical protein
MFKIKQRFRSLMHLSLKLLSYMIFNNINLTNIYLSYNMFGIIP